MVRLKDPSRRALEERNGGPIAYADWIGFAAHERTRHFSLRDDVVATVTLSEENGRVTVFVDGSSTTTVAEKSAVGGGQSSALNRGAAPLLWLRRAPSVGPA